MSDPIDGQGVQNPTETPAQDGGAASFLAGADDAGAAAGGDGTPGTGDPGTADPAAADGDKEGDKPAGPPEKYDLKQPEGHDDLGVLAQFEPLAREFNLSNEQAQKLVDFYHKEIAPKNAATQEEGIRQFYKVLHDECAKIPKEEIGLAKAGLLKFGDEGKKLLDDPYIGSNPDFLRFMARVGKLVTDAKFIDGNPGGEEPMAPHKALYPSMR